MASPASASSVRAGAGLRLLRAAVFTAVCVVLAAAGHSLASGRSVPVWSLVLGWLAVFAVVAPLAGRERRMPAIAAVLAVGQLTLHAVFNAGQLCTGAGTAAAGGQGGQGAGASGGLLDVAARLVCGSHAAALTPQGARHIVSQAGLDPSALAGPSGAMPGMSVPMASGAMAHSLCSLPMVLGHLLAAVVAGWILRRGEAALWRLARGASGLAAVLRRAFTLLSRLTAWVPSSGAACPPPAPRAPHRTVWLRHTVARRGPPRVVLAA
ncbi:hypothetical protein SAMN05216267_100513 [Actinacidiphila rubida]|uniref:Integral membrane protein n=1 Tax=Actinacidiphila rubida TaxID=310780 RepID=A0A1H8GDA1_9ACTN|nr:hypothetical protein [Actinacidiphila rubida]SEN41487.1 hypothetical protein SAMN05216267_100513 [Actinacidiphila rubida]